LNKSALAAAALVLNAFVFALSWWPFRALQTHGLHPLWATSLSLGAALVCLILLRPLAWRGFFKHPMLWLLLLASGLTNVGFNWAVTVGDVVRVVLLFYLMPAWVVVLAWPLLGEKPRTGSVFRLLLALAGVVIVLKTPASPWPLPETLADWLALMAGLCFALTNILLRKLNQTPGDARMLAMFAGGTLMATGAALLGMHWGLVQALPALSASWSVLALFTGLAMLAANLALQYGAAHLNASTTSIIMLSEVVFASVSSVLLGTGELSLRTLLGGALILLASLLAVVSFGRR
jgi:drug/metabolite transporter (DMT)-like permease